MKNNQNANNSNYKSEHQNLAANAKVGKGAVGKRSVRSIKITSEITVTDGKATFAVPGAVFSMMCATQGTCKATVPFLHFFETDRILRTIQLPINYTDGDILRLKIEGYTDEELDFNKFIKKISEAEDNFQINILRAHNLLKQYGIKYDELKEFANVKLYNKRV